MNLLNCLGVGVVASNKETNTDEIMVILPKDMPSQDGEIISNIEETNTTYSTTTGDTKTSKVLVGNAVPAKWLRLNSNRITPPDVRQGTKVVLYQFMNSNSYLWTLYGLDNTLRLETVVWAFSASPKIDENTAVTPDNFYMFKVSTHQKKIELLTGQGNGEPLGFQFTLNLADGWWGTMDSNMNMFVVNGVERSFTYSNQDKTTLSVNQKDFTLLNEGKSFIQSKESVTFKTKKYTVIADEDYSLKTKNAVVVADDGYLITTDNFVGDTGVVDWTSPNGFNLSGNVKIDGMVNASLIISTPVDVTAGPISLIGHVHGGVKGGNSKTSVPI